MHPVAPFWLIRHGETPWNAGRLIMGQRDIPLNATGEDQARAAADGVARAGLRAGLVWTSPLTRARATADAMAAATGLPLRVMPGLRERDWGDLVGTPADTRPGDHETPPGGEPWPVFVRRAATAVACCTRATPWPWPPLIVAHAGIQRALRAYLGLPAHRERIPHAAPVLFDRGADGAWRAVVAGQPAM